MTGLVMVTRGGGCGNGKNSSKAAAAEMQNQQQLSLVDFILAALRKSMVSCRVDRQEDVVSAVEIGFPTNVQHLTHVTFDRFHGFLGLPLEFQVEIPCRVPSASVSVFGVSAESMQCSYDTRGNSVPTILLLMQERLYSQNGLKAEGIFRINPENSQEEHVRDQLNRGIVPEDIDVHCLAGLIKAWFRELPSGVLDGLSPEQVLQCNTEEEFVELVKQLKPTETALLNWAIDLMADVVEQEESNKMNARNIAMVFAPNMTQRGEAEDGDYSPMSSRSSGRQTDEEFDSQQEMDTSCESAGPASDDDDADEQHRYSYSSEERDEVESLSEIEESFLRQLDENEHAKNDFRKQLEGILCREDVISTTASTENGDSSVSFSDSKMETSGLSTSDGEDSRYTCVTLEDKVELKRSSGSMEDVDMVEVNMVESAVPVQ
uniref:Gtpase activating protein n=1 Tax=Solanum tuberosum TaxID=4113 RepID=M1C7X9_SOLTU